jgi:cystathionine beta-lyase
MSMAPRSEAELRSLTGIKWTKHPADVMPAWVADMDLAPPQFAVDAVKDLADRGDFGYNLTAVNQLPELFQSWQDRHHGWRPELEEIRAFDDVLQVIAQSIWMHTEPGDGIVLLTPIYPPFIKAVEGAGRTVVDVPLDTDGWRLNHATLAAAIDENTSAILLCSPHNPTGRVFDAEERQAIADVVVANDLLLISDEVWADLTHPGTAHAPMATVNDEVAARTVTISSASKAFNLAGLRCAMAHIGHPALRAEFDRLPPHFLGAVSSPGAEACLQCWTVGEPWLAETKSFLTERRDHLARRVKEELPEVPFLLPEATYLAWLDFSVFDLPDEPREWLFGHAKVALSPGPDFGHRGNGFVRINFATSETLLDELLDRIVGAISDARPNR